MPIAAASLQKVTGDAHVGDLYLRVSVDGQALNVEGYEDSSFIDSLEMREYIRFPCSLPAKEPNRAATSCRPGKSYIMA